MVCEGAGRHPFTMISSCFSSPSTVPAQMLRNLASICSISASFRVRAVASGCTSKNRAVTGLADFFILVNINRFRLKITEPKG